MVLQAHSEVSSVNGLLMPLDFDVSTYDAINFHVSAKVNDDSWKHFAGGWMGVAARFLSCCESDEVYTSIYKEFRESVSYQQRYLQERELFNFFVSGLSTLECFFYSLYALASIKDPVNFPTSDSDFSSVKYKLVKNLFAKHFPSQLSQKLSNLSSDSMYVEWVKVRNILIHRVAPSSALTFSNVTSLTKPREWKLDDHGHIKMPIDLWVTISRRSWLSNTLNSLLLETENFINTYIP